MNIVNINLNNIEPVYYVGYTGEANSTYIKIDITNYVNEKFAFAALVFKNGYNELTTLKLLENELNNSENKYFINIPIAYELTKTNKLKLVVAIYNQENDKIIQISKSPILNLSLDDSLNPNDTLLDSDINDIYKELFELEKRFNAQITLAENAANSANTAAGNADSLIVSINEKLAAGEFNGPIGPQGSKGDKGDTGAPGTTLYSELSDKPSINGHMLESGNQTSEQLELQSWLSTYDKYDISLLAVNDNEIKERGLFSSKKINDTYLSKKTAAFMHPIFQVDDLKLGRLMPSGGITSVTTHYHSAIFNNTLYYFDYDVTVRVTEGYMFSIYSAPDADSDAIERLCYKTTEKFTVPANTYFRFWIEKVGTTALSQVFSSPCEAYDIIIIESSYIENALAETNEKVENLETKVEQLFTDISSDITFDDLEGGKIYRVIQDCTLTDGSQTFDLEVNNLIWYDSEYKGAFIINKYGTYYIYANDDTRDWYSCYALNEYDLTQNGIIENIVIDNLLLQELSRLPHNKKILSEKAIATELKKKQDALTDADKQEIANLGKEKWTLLIDDILAEDMAANNKYEWNKDVNDNSYSVKEIFADVVFPNALTDKIAFQVDGNSPYAIMWGWLPVGTKKVRIRSKILDNGYIETEYIYYLSSENEIMSQNTLKNINGGMQLKSFTQLGIKSRGVAGTSALPAGTTVKIWSID